MQHCILNVIKCNRGIEVNYIDRTLQTQEMQWKNGWTMDTKMEKKGGANENQDRAIAGELMVVVVYVA